MKNLRVVKNFRFFSYPWEKEQEKYAKGVNKINKEMSTYWKYFSYFSPLWGKKLER